VSTVIAPRLSISLIRIDVIPPMLLSHDLRIVVKVLQAIRKIYKVKK